VARSNSGMAETVGRSESVKLAAREEGGVVRQVNPSGGWQMLGSLHIIHVMEQVLVGHPINLSIRGVGEPTTQTEKHRAIDETPMYGAETAGAHAAGDLQIGVYPCLYQLRGCATS
jgi:hypothetical protein